MSVWSGPSCISSASATAGETQDCKSNAGIIPPPFCGTTFRLQRLQKPLGSIIIPLITKDHPPIRMRQHTYVFLHPMVVGILGILFHSHCFHFHSVLPPLHK